jgi:hypothetical protein
MGLLTRTSALHDKHRKLQLDKTKQHYADKHNKKTQKKNTHKSMKVK